MSCQNVAITTLFSCSAANPCPSSPTRPCQRAEDCPLGGTCQAGFCAAPCVEGRCGCLGDAECPRDSCRQGTCALAGTSCITDTDCAPIRCVAQADAGWCLIGRNCLPRPGLTCADVR
jgi:hypothetical protein